METRTTNTTSKPPVQNILVIDDDEDIRNIIALALKTASYGIIQAKNGLDGLAAIKIHKPDLILCDVNMPKMDGNKLLGTVKEEVEFAGIPFIFLTGNTGTDEMRKGMQLGADDYLTKPFTTPELIAAVQTRLTKRNSLQKYYETQFDDIKSNILQSLPHEFRTPLNGILGFSELLMEMGPLPAEEVYEIGTMINRSGHRLHRLLENMILFGQLRVWEHDQDQIAKMRREFSSLDDIINSVALKQMVKHERHNTIRVSVNDSLVQMSSIHVTKIVDEVVDNALKFSKAGTNVLISSEENGRGIQIIIRDGGRGMSQEQIDKVSAFQQFERNLYEQQGAGLGLAIVKTLVELHGGSISLESQEHKGTSVTITLPKAMNV